MNKTLLVGLVLASVSMTTYAGHDRYQDRARVTHVTPQVERVNTPQQECHTEYVRESYYENSHRSNTGAIIGGVAGGLIGSRFGGGSGRIATAALGAGLGAIIGDRHDNRQSYGRRHVETRPVERCVSVDSWHEVNRGYLVDYEYNGRTYTTELDQRPGRFIPVNVSVKPSGYVTNVSYHNGYGNKHHYKGYKNKHYRKHNNKHYRKNHGYY
jgi:uncharacterized protein YcfJ